MQTLKRNQTTYHYKTYTSMSAIVDSDGNETGEYTYTYGTLTSGKAYISASTGASAEEMFGENLNYDKVMIMKSCPFNEYAQLWIEAPTNGAFDYKVVKIARSLNSVTVAIQKVTQNG